MAKTCTTAADGAYRIEIATLPHMHLFDPHTGDNLTTVGDALTAV